MRLLTTISLLAGLTATASSQPAPIASSGFVIVSGRVLDQSSVPVRSAEILVGETGLATRTDSTGAFRFDAIAVGTVTFTARRLGFMPHAVTVSLAPNTDRVIDFELELLAIPLSSVEVNATTGPFSARMERFNERRTHNSGGTFLTREDVERLGARTMTDLMRLTPGLRLNRDRRGRTSLSARGNTPACKMKFFVDGMEVDLYGLSVDDVVKVQDLQALEYYHGMSSAPAEFSGVNFKGDAQCGVLVVWTREGK